MGFLDKLRSALSTPAAPAEGHSYWFHVRCARCGETLTGRVDTRSELSEEEEGPGFFARKTLIGSGRCFNPIEVTIHFDASRQVSRREVSGGTFVDEGKDQPSA